MTQRLEAFVVSDRAVAAVPAQDRPNRRGRLRLLLLMMIGLALIGLSQSNLFRLTEVEVSGTERLNRDRVIEMARLSPGLLRWGLSPARVEARLLREPWIRSVQVHWNWNHLLIQVEERDPLSLLPYQGRWVATDETARILELVESPAGLNLPVISGVATGTALRGQILNHKGLQDVLYVLSWMAEPLRRQIAEVDVDTQGSLILYMVGGTTVQWGRVPETPDREFLMDQKVKNFGGAWGQVPRNRLAACRMDFRVDGLLSSSGCE